MPLKRSYTVAFGDNGKNIRYTAATLWKLLVICCSNGESSTHTMVLLVEPFVMVVQEH
jgi:hypothetical protein